MNANPQVLVVIPTDTGILESDLCGKPVSSYLRERLHECGAGEVKACRAEEVGSAPSPGETILIFDGRAWLSGAAVARLLERASAAAGSFLLVQSVEHESVMLAACLSGDAWSPRFERSAFRDAPTVEASQLDPHSTGRLIRSYEDLACVEQELLSERASAAMKQGVRVRDPRTLFIRGQLQCGAKVELETNVIIEGTVELGDGVRVGANSILRNCRIGANTRIHPFSLVEDASIGRDGFVGPYGRIRPGTVVEDRVQIGNYVEIKNSRVGTGSRINHHAFIGDAVLASEVTIGAGTITCNHDGVTTQRTVIGQGAYVGSGCSLIAPIQIGERAVVGAGSTITGDIPTAKLTLARSPQTIVEGWRGPKSSRRKE